MNRRRKPPSGEDYSQDWTTIERNKQADEGSTTRYSLPDILYNFVR